MGRGNKKNNNNKKRQKPNKSISSFWKQLPKYLSIIGFSFYAGVYYEETMMQREANERDKKYYLELQELTNRWNEKERNYQEEIDRLRKENMDNYIKSLGYEKVEETANK